MRGAQVHHRALPLARDGLHRLLQLRPRRAAGRRIKIVEDVAQEMPPVHAHQHGLVMLHHMPIEPDRAHAPRRQHHVR